MLEHRRCPVESRRRPRLRSTPDECGFAGCPVLETKLYSFNVNDGEHVSVTVENSAVVRGALPGSVAPARRHRHARRRQLRRVLAVAVECRMRAAAGSGESVSARDRCGRPGRHRQCARPAESADQYLRDGMRRRLRRQPRCDDQRAADVGEHRPGQKPPSQPVSPATPTVTARSGVDEVLSAVKNAVDGCGGD